MIRSRLLIPLMLGACAHNPVASPPSPEDVQPVVSEVRPVVANDGLGGRWAIVAVNGTKTDGLWLDLGGEGLGTVTKTRQGIFVGSPHPLTRAFLGCNNWHPNGWRRNGDKLTLGTEMSTRTERGCDQGTIALDDGAYAILRATMTMEFAPPSGLRLINEHGTLDLVRQQDVRR